MKNLSIAFLLVAAVLLSSGAAERPKAKPAAKGPAKSAANAPAKAPPFRWAANPMNHWKKGVETKKFDPKKDVRDPELPWTPKDLEAFDPALKGKRGWSLTYEAYKSLEKKFGKKRALAWWEQVLCSATKFDVGKSDLVNSWNYYGFMALQALDQGRIRQTAVALKKLGEKPGSYYGYRAYPTIRMYEEMKTFPRNPETIEFPKENVWMEKKPAQRKTVHAKDFGWNATDATQAIKTALEKGDEVVLDRMEAPWRITSIEMPSDRTLILEDGVKVLSTLPELAAGGKETMFRFKGTMNSAIIGRGSAYIGKCESAEERDRYFKGEAGTCVYFDGAENALVRDLTIAESFCDGVTLGGCHKMNRNIYLENLVLDHNARQACSMCNGYRIYFRNVDFVNTRGTAPSAGIDFEPSIQEVEATCEIYVLDSRFRNNRGGHVVFSESSTYPATVLFHNCDIEGYAYGAVHLNALCGLYMGNNTDAPSDIIFQDCRIGGCSWYPAVTIDNCNLFHVTFRGGELVCTQKGGGPVPPISFYLNRDYYNPLRKDRDWYQKEGSLYFDGLKITGWQGAEALGFDDRMGHYSVKNVGGSVTMNAKKISMNKYRYEAPDFQYGDLPVVSAADLKANEKAASAKDGQFAFHWGAPWWEGTGEYRLFSPNGTGGFTETVFSKEKNPEAASRAAKAGHAFARVGGHLFRIEKDSTVYFEVPAGSGAATLKLADLHHVQLLKGRDKLVKQYSSADRTDGHVFIRLKRASTPQVFGLKALHDHASFRFFPPFSGVVSCDPNGVPHCTLTPEVKK